MKENLFKILFLIFVISIFYLVLNPVFFNKDSKGDDYIVYSLDLSNYKVATFSGGCFWCMEPPFERLPGVAEVMNGYTGGNEADPKYQEVASGKTGHLESIQVYYDPDLISYETLLEVYWMSIDPTDPGGQFADRGNHYTTAIFYHDENQKILAEKSKDALASSGRFSLPIATVIREAMPFYPAETYHQDYYIKSSIQFDPYHKGSGRARFLDEVWGNEIMKYSKIYTKPDLEKIKSFLTPLQFKVTQENATEPPFNNLYWNNEDNEGIYVDIVSGEPLFSSKDMFDSGSGWPSFTKPLVPLHLMYKIDSNIGNNLIEVRSKFADSHLGHVFNDGPPPTGLRYCINSAALKFIPKNNLGKEGFPEFIKFFN